MKTVSFLSHNFDDDIITDSMSIFCQIDYFVRPSEILYGEARHVQMAITNLQRIFSTSI